MSNKSENSRKSLEENPNENPVEKLEKYLRSKYEFRYNEILVDPEYRKINSKDGFITLDEERELPEMRIELAKKNFKSYKGHLNDLVRTRSLSPSFNPFKSYFNSLPPWKEGDKDYIGELCQYIKVKDQDWFNLMLRKHLVRAVACSLRMIEFNKHCFTLQGKQHDGKTSFIRFLSPPILKGYFKEKLDLSSKDSQVALGQNFIINIDELDGLDKSDAKSVKSLFSQTDFKVRIPYGKKDITLPRIASFFATINELEFLNDVTGNVRWLVFEVKEVLHDNGGKDGYSKININDVWAQAYSLMRAGYDCQLSKDEINEVNKRNRAYEKSFPEKELVQKYFEPATEEHAGAYFLTSTDIVQALQYAVQQSVKINPVMVGRAMTALEFGKEKKKVYGYWVRPIDFKISEILRNHLTILPNLV